MRNVLVGWVLCVSLVAVAACGSDDEDSGTTSAPCNERGGECPAGQVCWPNASQTGFECLNAAAGVGEGSTCVNTVGSPTCDEGLACLMLQGQTSGTCRPCCDPAIAGKGCAAGQTCTQVIMVNIGNAYVCVGSSATPPADAGPEASSSDGGG